MLSRRLLFCLLVVIGACWVRPAHAQLRTFHVAASGADSNTGTSMAPWRTLQHAANSVQAGDLVIVRAGTYTGFELTGSGTATHPIEFRAEPGVIVNLPNPVRGQHGINLEGASWIVVQGFTVIDMPRAGIRAVTNHHVTIRGNTLDSNGYWGVLTGFSDDVTIEDNVASRSAVEHGVYVSNSGDRPIIRRNHVWGNRAHGIHMNGDVSLGGDGIISGALVEANLIHGNGVGGGSGINCDGVQSSRFLNNLLYDNHAGGITLYRIDGGASAINNLVAHNTIRQAADGRWAINITNASTGNRVFNNILFNEHSFRGSLTVSADSVPGLVSDYNVVMNRFSTDDGNPRITLAQWHTATGQDLHSVIAAPGDLFVNAPGHDYYLSATSPARDAGAALVEVTTDRDGVPRPSGPAVDVGAYENTAHQFTDSPLIAMTTPVRAVHLTELRAAIDTVRARRSLPAVNWTDATIVAGVTPVRDAHVVELRSALDAVYAADGLAPPAWTPVLTAGVTTITVAQLEQVRQMIRAVE